MNTIFNSKSGILSNRGYHKIASILTLWFFLFSSFGIDPSMAQSVSPGGTGFDDTAILDAAGDLDVNEITIPLSVGEIKDRYEGTNGKTIIHIQDAHCNYAAQQSIQNIINAITSTYGEVGLMGLEGGAGEYDLSLFTSIPDPSVREKVSDYFVREGRVSGAENFAINNPGKIELFGIEDEKLYFGNLEAYRESLQYKVEADRDIKKLSEVLDNFKRKIYTADLKRIDDGIGQYMKGDIGVKGYVVFLSDEAGKMGIELKEYSTVSSLLSILAKEKEIDFAEAEKERKRLIYEVEKKVSKSVMNEIAEKTVLLGAGEITNEEFYSYLLKMADFSGVDFSSMPNLTKYADYVKAYDALDRAAIFDEIDGIEDAIMMASSVTDDQKTLYFLGKDLRMLEKMSDVSLVKEEFEYYADGREDFRARRFLDFIYSRGPLYGLDFKMDMEADALDGYIDMMEKFYDYSFKRDEAFLGNIESRMDKDGIAGTILVTGGFHTENLSELFKEKGYSYVEVMPKFGDTDVPCPYYSLLSGGNTVLEKIIDEAINPAASAIAVQSIFSKMRIDPENRNMQELKAYLLEAVYESELTGQELNVPVLLGQGDNKFLITFSKGDQGDMPGSSINLGGGMSLTFSTQNGPEEAGVFTVPSLVLKKGVNVSKLNAIDPLLQQILIDGPGIAAGKTRLSDNPDLMRDVKKELVQNFDFSPAEADKILGATDSPMHNIFIWNKPLKVTGVEIMGHIGKREKDDLNGDKVARGEYADREKAENGVIYLSPTLLERPVLGSQYSGLIIGLLHETGELYGMRHDKMLDLKTARNKTPEELKKYAKEILNRIGNENRAKIVETAMGNVFLGNLSFESARKEILSAGIETGFEESILKSIEKIQALKAKVRRLNKELKEAIYLEESGRKEDFKIWSTEISIKMEEKKLYELWSSRARIINMRETVNTLFGEYGERETEMERYVDLVAPLRSRFASDQASEWDINDWVVFLSNLLDEQENGNVKDLGFSGDKDLVKITRLNILRDSNSKMVDIYDVHSKGKANTYTRDQVDAAVNAVEKETTPDEETMMLRYWRDMLADYADPSAIRRSEGNYVLDRTSVGEINTTFAEDMSLFSPIMEELREKFAADTASDWNEADWLDFMDNVWKQFEKLNVINAVRGVENERERIIKYRLAGIWEKTYYGGAARIYTVNLLGIKNTYTREQVEKAREIVEKGIEEISPEEQKEVLDFWKNRIEKDIDYLGSESERIMKLEREKITQEGIFEEPAPAEKFLKEAWDRIENLTLSRDKILTELAEISTEAVPEGEPDLTDLDRQIAELTKLEKELASEADKTFTEKNRRENTPEAKAEDYEYEGIKMTYSDAFMNLARARERAQERANRFKGMREQRLSDWKESKEAPARKEQRLLERVSEINEEVAEIQKEIEALLETGEMEPDPELLGTAMTGDDLGPEAGEVSMEEYESPVDSDAMIAVAVERGLLPEGAVSSTQKLIADLKTLEVLRESYAQSTLGRWDKATWEGFMDNLIQAVENGEVSLNDVNNNGTFYEIRGEYLLEMAQEEAEGGNKEFIDMLAARNDPNNHPDFLRRNFNYYLYEEKLTPEEQIRVLEHWANKLAEDWESALEAEGKNPKRGNGWTVAERIMSEDPAQGFSFLKNITLGSSYNTSDYAPRNETFYSEEAYGELSVYTGPGEETVAQRNKRVKEEKTKFLQGWAPWLDRVAGFGEEVLQVVFPGMFDGQKSVIAVGITPEEWDNHLSDITGTRTAAQSVTSMKISKDITILHYKATADGVKNLETQMKKYFNVSDLSSVKSRIAVTAPRNSDDKALVAQLKELENVSYKVVYSSDSVSRYPDVTPVGASVFTGLALLNKSYLEEKEKQGKGVTDIEKSDAVNLVLKGMVVMSGGVISDQELKGLADRIKAQGYSLAGIELVVVIRPIDVNQIKDFHEKDRLVMKSL